jgi:hypothetical protein
MANQRKNDAVLMAQALAGLILIHRASVDSLLAEYDVNSRGMNASDTLFQVERLIRTNKNFGKRIIDLIAEKANYRGFIDAIIGGVSSAINGIVDATNPASQEAKKTMAQSALLQAQAQIEMAKAAQIKASKSANLPLIVGVAVGGMVLAISIFAYFKYRKNKGGK